MMTVEESNGVQLEEQNCSLPHHQSKSFCKLLW